MTRSAESVKARREEPVRYARACLTGFFRFPPTGGPVLQKLVQGVRRFERGISGPQRELFARLAEGQHPDALFITCSDSRISPNLITQTDPGELFIIRNAGNIVPPYGAANGGD